MKKISFSLFLFLIVIYQIKAQSNPFKIDLINGKKDYTKISFRLDTEGLSKFLGQDLDKKIFNIAQYANIQLMLSMQNQLSYIPIQTGDNVIMYFEDNKVAVKLSCSAKNGIGNVIEKTYTVILNSNDYSSMDNIELYRIYD
ncbi:hypothetical protein [Mongoliitalea daihaiensis]|uniref:hypothetical protein n=1 Tax=Mongoliitalea daihaiensis TaxID=2782006 RepID=UPI001F242AF4|nr:hypothetical protein [Mongoliitalea daihaiensis]UJP63973.1 hypothetical protein IPZ59_14235 [Mongoliitalea daihaiensis]